MRPNGSRLARVGVGVRNELMYRPDRRRRRRLDQLTGWMSSSLRRSCRSSSTSTPRDRTSTTTASTRTYTLTNLATGKVVVKGQTFARVSYNIPGQEQRFAGERGLRDAENRAAKEIAENIRSRLASYFVAGT